jgi:hypothetical protein
MPGQKESQKRNIRDALEGQIPLQDEHHPPQSPSQQPAHPPAQQPPRQTEVQAPQQPGQMAPQSDGLSPQDLSRVRDVAVGLVYYLRSHGYERPPEVYANAEEARAFTSGLLNEAVSALTSQGEPVPPPPTAAELELAKEKQEILTARSATVTGWMSRDFLGETVYARLTETPPVAVNETTSWCETVNSALGFPSGGGYNTGSNLVFVRLPDEEAYSFVLIAHEQLHYASFLGGGMDIRWKDENDLPHIQRDGFWNIYEGLTELHAQMLVRSHGIDPDGVVRPYETAVSFVMQQVVGEEPLRRAYFSGDFTEVRSLFDQRLGAGTFDTLMATQVGAEAYSIIMQKASAAGYDTASWESNPIMGCCYEQIAYVMEKF